MALPSAELLSRAMLASLTLKEDTDPVEVFFELLPSPAEHHHMTGDELGDPVNIALMNFFRAARLRQSADPDFSTIYRILDTQRRTASIYNQLCALALDKTIDQNDSSHKARQLRYLRWVAHGRKDEMSPFAVVADGEDRPHASANPNAADPQLACKACGVREATMKCGGCRIGGGDDATFSTAYCSEECQVKDWPKHKATCKQIQSLIRATDIVYDILHHLLAVTHVDTQLTSITVENGVVVATHTSARVITGSRIKRFPVGLATTLDLADAVMMVNNCITPTTSGRSLVELFIRPLCRMITNQSFMPKNVTRPVRMVYAGDSEFSHLALHQVLRLSLPCGSEFALDLTGAQLGWQHKLVPWEAYVRRHVLRFAESNVVEPQLPGHRRILYEMGDKSGERYSMSQVIMETVSHGLWKQLGCGSAEGNVRKILRSKDMEYKETRAHLVDAARRGLSHLVNEVDKGATSRCDCSADVIALLALGHPSQEAAVCSACSRAELYFSKTADSANRKLVIGVPLEYMQEFRWFNALRLPSAAYPLNIRDFPHF